MAAREDQTPVAREPLPVTRRFAALKDALPPTVLHGKCQRYTNCTYLGSGLFGVVFRYTDKKSGAAVAVKKLGNGHESVPFGQFKIPSEVAILNHVAGCPNVCNLVDFVRDGDGHVLDRMFIMEYCDFHLKDVMDRPKELPQSVTVTVLEQCLLGVDYIHMQGIMHNDIHVQNVIVEMSTGLVKIIDFGKAQQSKGAVPRAKAFPDLRSLSLAIVSLATRRDVATMGPWGIADVIDNMSEDALLLTRAKEKGYYKDDVRWACWKLLHEEDSRDLLPHTRHDENTAKKQFFQAVLRTVGKFGQPIVGELANVLYGLQTDLPRPYAMTTVDALLSAIFEAPKADLRAELSHVK